MLKLITILEGAYGKDFSDKSIDVYSVMLADLPYQEVQRAIVQLIATSKWLPSIAEIRLAAVEAGQQAPSAEEAWIEVREAARQFSPYTEFRWQWSHPLVRKAAEVLGGVEGIGYSDNIQYLGNQFRQVYERLRESEIMRQQTAGIPLLQAPERGKVRALPKRGETA